MSSKIKHLMTTADLQAIPYNEWHQYELIEGELYVSFTAHIPHQLVLGNLSYSLGMYLQHNPIGIVVPRPGVILSDYDSVIPDIVFVSNERKEGIIANEYFIAVPDLVIEIIWPTPGSRSRDLKTKRKLYGKYRVREYWVVDIRSQSLIIFRLEESTLRQLTTLRKNDTLESPLFPEFSLSLSVIFNGIAV